MAVKFTTVANIYVDPYYGNDTTGAGTKENPYATANKAATMATTGQTVCLASGEYKEIISSNKNIKWIGEGLVVFNGESLAVGSTSFGSATWQYFENITFVKYTGTKNAVAFASSGTTITKCRFYYCNTTQASSAGVTITYSIFVNVVFNVVAFGSSQISTLKNNIFHTCFGTFWFSLAVGTTVINNHFVNSTMFSNSALGGTKPANTEVDYNNIVNSTLFAASYAALPAWAKTNSLNTALANHGDIFTDVDLTRNDLVWWKDDFTLKTTSPNKAVGKAGEHIGAWGVGYSFTANTIWTNKASSSGLVYNATKAVIELDTGFTTGDLQTNEFDLGANITFDFLRVFRQTVYYSSGVASELVDYNIDDASNTAVNQRTSYDIEVAYSTTSGAATTFKKFEMGRQMSVDGTGNGTGEYAYDPTTSVLITARYVRFRLKIRQQ